MQQHPGLQQNQQLDVDNMEADEADDEWPAWNPAVFAADNGQVLHQHPQFPQDHLDLELSGSSMRFLRGDGTDISLDRVLEGISVEDGSSSSSDASPTLVEDRARFAAAQKRCTIILIFNRKYMPDEVFHRASFSQANDNMGPIVIDRAVLQPSLNLSSPTPAITGMEIVTWKPVLPALALQLWPSVVASRRAACAQPRSSVIILPDPRVEQGPATSGSSGFEFQSEQMQPSPCGEAGMRVYQRRRIAMLSLPVASSNTISPVVEGSVSRSTRMNNNMSLPDVSSNPATPLVDSTMRRSTRLSDKDGFHEVRLAGNPCKKTKTCPVLLVEPAGQTGPIPIDILQGWGINCGVAPGELSQEALMQALSSNPVANDESFD